MNKTEIFKDYPDALGIDELCKMLRIGKTLAYRVLIEGKIKAKKIGRSWLVAKCDVVEYLLEERKL